MVYGLWKGNIKMSVVRIVVVGLFLCQTPRVLQAEDFALQDGDTVAFLGDSITAARTYGKLIENYTLLRYPERRVRFFNAGRGGETAEGALARLDRDVFARGATVLTVAYGVNDIGWGFHADDEHKQRYLNAIEEIVQRCNDRKVRVFICSAAITGADPAKTENEFLQKMCDEGLKRAREKGGRTIDVQRVMREIQKRVWKANETIEDAAKKESLHVADGIHLSQLGQTAMAYAILKGLGAPADVSSVSLDAKAGKLLESSGCQVSDISTEAESLQFSRLDEGLPLNGETFFGLQFRFVPIHTELNRYMLQVKSLSEGKYDVIVDDRKVGTYSASELEKSVNISSATPDPWQPGGPWDVQANILHSLTESRDKLDLSMLLTHANQPEKTRSQPFLENARVANAQL